MPLWNTKCTQDGSDHIHKTCIIYKEMNILDKWYQVLKYHTPNMEVKITIANILFLQQWYKISLAKNSAI